MAYSDADRLLTVRGTLTYPDTGTQALTSAHISSFLVNEDAGRDVPVGAAPAASFELKLDNSSGQWEPGGSILGAHILDGAKVEIEIGLWNGATYDYSDIGTYYVDDVQGQEHETLIRLKGSDAMVSLMSEYYADGAGDYPQTLGSLLTDVASVAGVTLESVVFTNSAVSIPAQPAWKNNLTCREAVGYIAACAGGIARFNRAGKLEIAPLEKVSSRAVSTSVYKTIQKGDTFFGGLNAINVYAYGAPDGTSPSRYATTPATPDTSLNSINIKGNPILAYGSTALAALGAGMLSALTGLAFRGATFEWHGDPAMELGELCTVTDLSSTAIPILITKQTLRFASGFSMNSGCAVTTSTKADASGKLQKIFTPTGNLNAEALAGNIYVKAGEKMTLESGGDLNLLAGGNLNIKNLGNTANVINMDNTGLTLSSTGQLKLQSTDSIIIGGSPFSVGGRNLLRNSGFEGITHDWKIGGGATTSLVTGADAYEGRSLRVTMPMATAWAYTRRTLTGLRVGQEYTVSFMMLNWYDVQVQVVDNPGYVFVPTSSTYKKFVASFVATSDTTSVVVYSTNSPTFAYYVYIDNEQLEEGPIATDWSPSPQDTVDALAGIGTQITELQSKTTVHYGPSKPTYTAVGDIWYESANGGMYRCTNVSTQAHTEITSVALKQALSAATAAQTTANGKINTFVGSSTPTALAAGDLWMDTGNKNIWKRATAAGTGGWVQYLTAAGYLITTGITIDGTDLTVKATGNLNLAADGNLNVQNGGNLNVLNGGDIEVNNGGDINVASGGKINVSATDLMISGKTVETYASDKIRLEVSVGGTNLLRNSGRFKNLEHWWLWDSAGTSTMGLADIDRWGDTPIYITVPSASTIFGNSSINAHPFTLGEEYTISFWAMYTSTYSVQIMDSNGQNMVVNFGSLTPKNTVGNWSYYEATAKVTGAPNVPTLYINIGTNNYRRFARFKLEKGTKATDWSLSPSDPASGVKTSYIDIASDHIDISSGGNLSITSPNTLKITSGTTNATALAVRNDTDYFISAGHLTQSSAPFSVKRDGSVKATSGVIGGFTLAPGSLSAQASGKPLLKLDTANSEIILGGLKLFYSGSSEYEFNVGTDELRVTASYFGVVGANVFFDVMDGYAWCNGNMSAASFTDRTPAYTGKNAVAELKLVRNDKNGNIDHSTLPAFARKKITSKDKKSKESEADGRDLGAMISILTKAVQELDGRLEKIENRTK